MGFGSYDESEQKNDDVDVDEDSGVTVHENAHEGKIEFDSEASNDELIEQLQEMKEE